MMNRSPRSVAAALALGVLLTALTAVLGPPPASASAIVLCAGTCPVGGLPGVPLGNGIPNGADALGGIDVDDIIEIGGLLLGPIGWEEPIVATGSVIVYVGPTVLEAPEIDLRAGRDLFIDSNVMIETDALSLSSGAVPFESEPPPFTADPFIVSILAPLDRPLRIRAEVDITVMAAPAIPEPGTVLLVGLGLLAIARRSAARRP